MLMNSLLVIAMEQSNGTIEKSKPLTVISKTITRVIYAANTNIFKSGVRSVLILQKYKYSITKK